VSEQEQALPRQRCPHADRKERLRGYGEAGASDASIFYRLLRRLGRMNPRALLKLVWNNTPGFIQLVIIVFGGMVVVTLLNIASLFIDGKEEL
jgi:hypothetical protein